MAFPTFAAWVAAYGKVYNGDEAANREAIFNVNMDVIEQLNAETSSATFGLGPFTDLAADEFAAKFMGFDSSMNQDLPEMITDLEMIDLEVDFDWVKKGAVNPIKDQGECGSCWAFSTIANLEGAGFVSSGKLVSLSEQQLVDCDKKDNGCEGGLPTNSFGWIKKTTGVTSDSAYPYKSGTTQKKGKCQKGNEPVTSITGFSSIQGVDNLVAGLQQYGPLSIGMHANALQHYTSGVFDSLCIGQPNHGVAIVGMGTDSGKQYWKVRNSWGTDFGEKGYFRIVRGQNKCKVESDVSTSTGVTVNAAGQITV